jgi:predicted glutamine amidotransferase
MLIVQKPNTTIDHDTLVRCREGNTCGAGVMFVDKENQLNILKTLDINKFWEVYENVVKEHGSSSPIVLHFRAGSKVTEENCHPFRVNDTLGFAHNGYINNVGESETLSDTNLFNETILKKLDGDIINNTAIQMLIEDFVDGNKLVFMNNKKQIYQKESFTP